MNVVGKHLLVVSLATGLALAQEGTGGKQRIQNEIKSMRRQMQEGTLVQTNVRVTVRLANGNKIIGVVKNGRFVEKPDGLEFVEADRKTLGAGIRVWYSDNTNSCIFLAYADIETYTIGAKLTEAQIAAIEERLDKERKAAELARESQLSRKKAEEEARKQLEEAKSKGGTPGDVAKEKPKTAEQEAATPEGAKVLALLQEFPPEQGWGEEKAQELEKRKITLSVFPNETEKRFLANLGEWKKGLDLQKRLDAEKDAATKKVEGPKPAK